MAPKEKAGHPTFGSRESSVDIVQKGDGFVLTIGYVSIWFDPRTAQKILLLLGDALGTNVVESLASKDSN
jgi:hypothetical protein